MRYKELLRASMKSADTEEWLDVWFTRPVGLAFALLWWRLGVHPNAVTLLGIVLGVTAGWLMHFTDMTHNLWAILLLVLANLCDSTDGQLARLSGKKTRLGRFLDGFAGDLWFIAIYIALIVRLSHQPMPFAGGVEWGAWGAFVLCFLAGVMSHMPQASLADYYRQAHLYFLLGREGSELDTSAQQLERLRNVPSGHWFTRAYLYFYYHYCRGQESRTPHFQQLMSQVRSRWSDASQMPQSLRDDFRRGSLPLMKWTNVLTFNCRALLLYASCLVDQVWIYPLAEVTLFNVIYLYMRSKHERLSERLYL